MLRAVVRRLRYADVVATLALFLALGGGAYAAVKLPRDSVGAGQVVRGAIRSSEVKDHSLLAKDFKAGQLPRGATGATGAPGTPGMAGAPGAKGDTGPSDTTTKALAPDTTVGSDLTPVGALALPAGTYLITAKVVLRAEHSGTYVYVHDCVLTAGTDTDETKVEHSQQGGYDGYDALPLTLTHVATAPTTVTVACSTNSGVFGDVRGGVLMATRVGTVR